jgi:hypothetical protein
MVVSRNPTQFNSQTHIDQIIRYKTGSAAAAALKPTPLLALFHTPQLAPVAQKVEDTIVRIMQEAAAD